MAVLRRHICDTVPAILRSYALDQRLEGRRLGAGAFRILLSETSDARPAEGWVPKRFARVRQGYPSGVL